MDEPITVRLLDIFRIGLGPSSSHTVGPMRAAARFRAACLENGVRPARLRVLLKGSLSATGRGHGTDRAIMAGLLGIVSQAPAATAGPLVEEQVSMEALGRVLVDVDGFILPFEVASVLLVAALVGAILVAMTPARGD